MNPQNESAIQALARLMRAGVLPYFQPIRGPHKGSNLPARRVTGGFRHGKVETNDPVKTEAARIVAANRAYNATRPSHEHKPTSVRKIRKRVRRTRNAA